MTPDPHRIALEVLACPAVAGLHSGPHGETVTQLAAGRVVGIRIADGTITVGVVGRYPAGVAEIAEQVRAAVARHAAGAAVVVVVEDLYVDDEGAP